MIFRALILAFTILMANNFNAQDWAQLGYYQAANKDLVPRAEGEERVVFIGNSITEGWKNSSSSIFLNPVNINRGIGGQTTAQMKIRFWQDVIMLQPTKVVILGGINDIAQNRGFVPILETAQNIMDMAQMAVAQNIEVLICSVLPANYFPWRPSILPAEKIIELNNILTKFARDKNFQYVNYYSQMVNEEKGMIASYTFDGVHCTDKGYQVMKRIITPILNQ